MLKIKESFRQLPRYFINFPFYVFAFFSSIETPILHELAAVGGNDDVRFLYERLLSYFPQITSSEISQIRQGDNPAWRKAVKKPGECSKKKALSDEIVDFWTITAKGKVFIESESTGFTLTITKTDELNHLKVQELLVEIAESLGFYAEMEFEFYDVVWRESKNSRRISHVFEVQSKGNIDSAFAKLKRAFDAQRSKPFLILSTERDTNRARKSLELEFRELENSLTILSFAELRKIHENLTAIADFLPKFLLV